MVYIDNGVCIDCMACVPVCPVQAIFSADELPEDKKQWISINAERAALLPVIDTKQEPLPGAEERRVELGYAVTSVSRD